MIIPAKVGRHVARPWLLWSLACLLFFQSTVIAYLGQPRPVKAGNGSWVLVCSMQGMKKFADSEQLAGKQQKQAGKCPFCALSNDLHSVLLTSSPYSPATEISSQPHVVMHDVPVLVSATPAFHIRAPPSV